MPTEFLLWPSRLDQAGLGVYSSVFIPKYTWIGEYQGEFVPLNLSTGVYAWDVSKECD